MLAYFGEPVWEAIVRGDKYRARHRAMFMLTKAHESLSLAAQKRGKTMVNELRVFGAEAECARYEDDVDRVVRHAAACFDRLNVAVNSGAVRQ